MRTFAQKPKGTQQTKPAKPKISSRAKLGQSGEVGLGLHLQRTIGNQAVQPLLDVNNARVDEDATTASSPRFVHDFSRISVYAQGPVRRQATLTVNTPGNVYEQEADRIAEQVMATPAHTAVRGAPPRIQRFSGQSSGQINAAPASVDQALANPGRPLEPALRQDMEQRFGYDFSTVRVHTGSLAEQSALDVNANAYTVGHNIVFGAVRYSPGTQDGRRLLAHELAHVVQQSGAEGMFNRRHLLSPVAGMLCLQRATGNRAVRMVLQRALGPSKPATLEPKALDRLRVFRRDLTHAQELRQIADNLIEKELGAPPRRSL